MQPKSEKQTAGEPDSVLQATVNLPANPEWHPYGCNIGLMVYKKGRLQGGIERQNDAAVDVQQPVDNGSLIQPPPRMSFTIERTRLINKQDKVTV
ncbi:hypothetical protein PL78_09385 [Yersinia entomophaga]|uniref:Uncharacterized protein n=1 Tax=Yersinia entomophaga TaxID=935293 RepID=A0ABN4PUZ6_YERET|nr:hypothetical protein PL78_09385 [Yersinia entomophaga]